MLRHLTRIVLTAAIASMLTNTASLAASEIVVMSDEAKLVSVGGDVSTVVVVQRGSHKPQRVSDV